MSKIEAIIFDLGNVLIDLNLDATKTAFEALLGNDFERIYRNGHWEGPFQEYELGAIPEKEFLDAIRRLAGRAISDAELLTAWNRILNNVPAHRLEMLQEVGRRLPLFLLSNTNATHVEWLGRELTADYGLSLEAFNTSILRKAYYSHEVRMRKPDAEIYEFVLKDAGLDPAVTLFIDDNAANIRTAAALGLRTHHHQPDEEVVEVVRRWIG